MTRLQEFDGNEGSGPGMSAVADDRAQLPVLIVGGGFSGTLLAINIARQGVPVVLFERDQAALAKGLAFGTRRPEHLLNVRAANMSAFPDDPGHFLRWMGFSDADQCNRFVPRLAYGQYLREVLINSLGQTRRPLHVRADDVVDLVETAQGVDAVLADGRVVAGRTAVLALGHCLPRLPAPLAMLPPPLAWADPWHPEALAGLRPDDRVVLVGTGLTAIDLILSLDRSGHRGPIVALSRRGLVPRAHLPSGPDVAQVPAPTARSTALVGAVRRRAAQVGWRLAIDELRPHTQALWRAHDARAQASFLRHLRPFWDVHRHRLAPEIGARLDALQAEGRLRFVAGRLVDASVDADAAVLHWRPRGSNAIATLAAARVINCIGPEGDIAQARQPLIQALLGRGAMRADVHRLGLDVDPQWRVIGHAGQANPRIHAVGPLTKGIAWEMIAVPDIRQQVWALARLLAGVATL
ncbi:FAD/NAD(P)-binding protein [Novosphingobium sp. FSW06-99]|uniref:FAD/NAD(P)-binding protein n=1 Tax=Novosphingobium sp. FSW06-99 TaxID=1739113 RepID=UPI000A9FCB7E|nr:FAD/NAD(P)-binding protein [Novosphingobium sp. FSW06-99]